MILLLNFKFLLRDCKRLSYLCLPGIPNRVETGSGHVLSRLGTSDPVYKISGSDMCIIMVSGPDQNNKLSM